MSQHNLGRSDAGTKPFHIHSSVLVKLECSIGDRVWIDFDDTTLFISSHNKERVGYTTKVIGGIGKNTSEDYYPLNSSPSGARDKWSSRKDLPDWFSVRIV